MTPIERAQCKSCANNKVCPKRGLVCGLTDHKPKFQNTCEAYQIDVSQQMRRFNNLLETELYASKGKRLANYLIDNFIVWSLVGVIFGIDMYLGIMVPGSGFFLAFPIFFFYYFLMEYQFGQTIGKMATQTKVIRVIGYDKPSALQVGVRAFLRMPIIRDFNATCFLLGYHLHDAASGTIVIKDDKRALLELETLDRLKHGLPVPDYSFESDGSVLEGTTF